MNKTRVLAKRSRSITAKKKETRKGFFADFHIQFFKSLLSTVLAKVILGAIVSTGLISFLYNRYIYNPPVEVFIEGKISDYYNSEKPVQNCQVYVEGKNVSFKPNHKGEFSGRLTIRKRETILKLNVIGNDYKPETKPVYIPLDKNPQIHTDFTMEPFSEVGFPEPITVSER